MTAFQAPGNYRLRMPGYDDWALTMPTTARCLFCSASFTGTAAEAAVWGAEHRRAEHPRAVDRGQRVRARAAKQAGGW